MKKDRPIPAEVQAAFASFWDAYPKPLENPRKPALLVFADLVASAPKALCVWAHYHPSAVAKLADTPPWLVKAAVAADLWRNGHCDHCPCYDVGDPHRPDRTAPQPLPTLDRHLRSTPAGLVERRVRDDGQRQPDRQSRRRLNGPQRPLKPAASLL